MFARSIPDVSDKLCGGFLVVNVTLWSPSLAAFMASMPPTAPEGAYMLTPVVCEARLRLMNKFSDNRAPVLIMRRFLPLETIRLP